MFSEFIGKEQDNRLFESETAKRVRLVFVTEINNKKYLFLQQRQKLRWEFPGGGVEPNESRLVSLHREIKEELGIELKKCCVLYLGTHTSSFIRQEKLTSQQTVVYASFLDATTIFNIEIKDNDLTGRAILLELGEFNRLINQHNQKFQAHHLKFPNDLELPENLLPQLNPECILEIDFESKTFRPAPNEENFSLSNTSRFGRNITAYSSSLSVNLAYLEN
ncbi:MAG: hypothetical protein OHK0017_05370 [Patescibacteria group bacterium]